MIQSELRHWRILFKQRPDHVFFLRIRLAWGMSRISLVRGIEKRSGYTQMWAAEVNQSCPEHWAGYLPQGRFLNPTPINASAQDIYASIERIFKERKWSECSSKRASKRSLQVRRMHPSIHPSMHELGGEWPLNFRWISKKHIYLESLYLYPTWFRTFFSLIRHLWLGASCQRFSIILGLKSSSIQFIAQYATTDSSC